MRQQKLIQENLPMPLAAQAVSQLPTAQGHGIFKTDNSKKIILHLCADMGSDSAPYRQAGYDVRCIGQNTDVRKFQPPENVYGIIANPPCTMFSFARTNAKLPRNLRQGMELVEACLRIIWECQYSIVNDAQKYSPLKFWVMENPNAMLKWFLGKPAMIYNPFEFGERYQKATCLWGLFNEPKRSPVILSERERERAKTNSQPLPKFDSLLSHEIAPEYFGKLSRQDRRSICSPKFAQAFFEANP